MLIILFGLPFFVTLWDFVGFLFTGKRLIPSIITKIVEFISVIILPWFYAGFGQKNDCCDDLLGTAFAPEHQITMAAMIIFCSLSYFYSSYRSKTAPPLIEVIVNIGIIIGIVLNIFMTIHVDNTELNIIGVVPIILLFILMLVTNQKMIWNELKDINIQPKNKLEYLCARLLVMNPIIKFPLLMILALPVLVIITSILLLFGQKPDSIILAFTQTYKHGFSQLDYQCNNVECGGHYLCSVAANGHKKVVKPERLGVRNGGTIVCNRQLLISNAFEDYIQENWPQLHRFIRSQYNKVGNVVHRYYGIFNNKLVADTIYVFMKPLEWFFLIVLYCVDFRPENRIARQYIARKDRQLIDAALAVNHLSTLPIKDESIH